MQLALVGGTTIAAVSSNQGGNTILSATSGPLVFAANVTSAGNLIATTSGPTTPASGTSEDIIVQSGVTLLSTGGNLGLRAAGDVVTQVGSALEAPRGTVTTKSMPDSDPSAGSPMTTSGPSFRRIV